MDADRVFLRRLAAEVTACRDDLGLSQAQVAERAGVSENTIFNFECRRGSAKIETVLAICRVVGVPLGAGSALRGRDAHHKEVAAMASVAPCGATTN